MYIDSLALPASAPHRIAYVKVSQKMYVERHVSIFYALML